MLLTYARKVLLKKKMETKNVHVEMEHDMKVEGEEADKGQEHEDEVNGDQVNEFPLKTISLQTWLAIKLPNKRKRASHN